MFLSAESASLHQPQDLRLHVQICPKSLPLLWRLMAGVRVLVGSWPGMGAGGSGGAG